MKLTFGRGALALASLLVIGVSAGCVDNDPIVTGNRPDAGPAADSGSGLATIVPGDDTADVDAPECRRCGDTLDTNKPRGTLCRKNTTASGVSSVRLLNALVDCACYDQCIDQCQSYCSGSKNTSTCQLCIAGKCAAGLAACQADKVE